MSIIYYSCHKATDKILVVSTFRILWKCILYLLRALGINEDAQIILYQIAKIFVHHLYCYGKYEGKETGIKFLPVSHLPCSWYNFAEFFPHILISFSEGGKDLNKWGERIIKSPFKLLYQTFKESN